MIHPANGEHNEINNDVRENVEQNEQNVPLIPIAEQPVGLQFGDQFGQLLERLCNKLSGKKENTWGKFDGNLSKWEGFRDAFKSEVHDDQHIKPVLKFQLLKSSLEGRAAASLGEWQITDQNYAEAWDWLNQLYARKYQTSKQILWKLLRFEKLEKESGYLIEKLISVTQEVTRQLRAMKFPVQHYDLIFVHTIHEKLDPETSKAWELHRQSETPTTQNMLEFLTQHGRALSSAQYTEKKLEKGKRRSNDKEHKFESKRAKFDNFKKENVSDKTKSDNKCKLCGGNPHPLYRCRQFMELNLKQRKAKVRELDVCFNCLSPNHRVADCSRDPCGRCETKKHNSLLCPENPKNKAVNVVQQSKSNKKPPKAKKEKENKNLTIRDASEQIANNTSAGVKRCAFITNRTCASVRK